MDNNFDEPFDALEGLFKTLIEGAPEKLLWAMERNDKDEVNISAPYLLVKRMQETMIRSYYFKPGDNCTFMGIKIIPSSDYALTLFHVDYPIFKEDWMIHKIPLDPLFVSKQSPNITKYVGQIKEFIPGKFSKDSSLN